MFLTLLWLQIIKLRVDNQEKAEIAKIASEQGLSTSEYIRHLHQINVRQPLDPQEVETLKETIATLAPIGNNLNQIARAINTNLASGLDLPENINLIHEIASIRSEIDKVKCSVKVLLANTMPRRTRNTPKKR